MRPGEMPPNEQTRLKALYDYGVLDSEREKSFDDLALIASKICGMPIALVSLVDLDRQWFKAKVGVDVNQTPRNIAFCSQAITGDEPLVVENALLDARFRDNPLVTGELGVRFYAGAPLKTPEGHNVGTLCVIDQRPNSLNADQLEALRALARQVVELLELRKLTTASDRRQKFLDTILGALPGLVSYVDPEYQYRYANQSYKKWFGLDPNEFVGKSVRDLAGVTTFNVIKPYLDKALAGEQQEFEAKIELRFGGVRDLHIQYIPDRQESGEIAGVFSLSRDNTDLNRSREESRRTQAKLLESEQLVQSVLQTLPVAVFAKNIKDNFKFTIWNKAAERLFGVAAIDIVGKHDADFFPKEQADFFRSKDVEASQTRGLIDIPEEEAKTAEGIKILHTRKTVVLDSTGQPSILLGACEDITEQKRAMKLIQDQQRQMVSSAKMSALGEMAGGIAHEINNPLAIILGLAGLIRGRLTEARFENEKVKSDLDKIEKTANRIAKIVRGLRSFSRNSESDPMETAKVSQIIEDCLELSREKFKFQSIELRIDYGPGVSIECRSSQIAQIIMNLLSNSLDAIRDLSERWISIHVSSNDQFVFIAITDSGPGIKPEIAEKMMQPFFTTKEIGAGTGLGLSISKGISEEHHGELIYEASKPNTQFTLKLPLRQPVRSKDKSVA